MVEHVFDLDNRERRRTGGRRITSIG